MELLFDKNVKIYSVDAKVSVYWADNTADAKFWYTDDQTILEKINNDELWIAEITIEINLDGIKFKHCPGDVLAATLDDISKSVEEVGAVEEAVDIFKVKLENILSKVNTHEKISTT